MSMATTDNGICVCCAGKHLGIGLTIALVHVVNSVALLYCSSTR